MPERDQIGRFAVKKAKAAKLPLHTVRCRGCHVLLAANRSVQDHELFCEKAQDRLELTPVRDIDFIRGDLRGYK